MKNSNSSQHDPILQGAINAVEAIFQVTAPITVKRELFDTACWLVSERIGKYTTRYRSEACAIAPRKLLRHDHIVPRKDLWFVVRRSMTVAEALAICEGCTVTKEEHVRLQNVERDAYGWERYVKAGVRVIDHQTGKEVPASKLMQMSRKYKTAFRNARFIDDGEELTEEMLRMRVSTVAKDARRV